jgi:hypothetical protein
VNTFSHGNGLAKVSACFFLFLLFSAFHHELKQHEALPKCGHIILDFTASRTMSPNKLTFFVRYSGIARKKMDNGKRQYTSSLYLNKKKELSI